MTTVDTDERRRLLDRIERYYDAVPRSATRVEDFGPLTLFVREGEGWPFYARPALGWSGEVSAANVARVRMRQRELGVPESFEWVDENAPALRAAVERTGLEVHEHPLMVLGPDVPTPAAPGPAGLPDGVAVRILAPDDPALPGALALPHLAFADPGTRVGTVGPAALREAVRSRAGDGAVRRAALRIQGGLTCFVAAVADAPGGAVAGGPGSAAAGRNADGAGSAAAGGSPDGAADGTALCVGQHQRVGRISEIVGVGTLPTARRRGLALAVTALLVADARSRGVETVFLSAGDGDVARIYARLGFRQVGTSLIAEPA